MHSAEACITDRIRISLDKPQEMSEVAPFKTFVLGGTVLAPLLLSNSCIPNCSNSKQHGWQLLEKRGSDFAIFENSE
jgi:hypothetical protein